MRPTRVLGVVALAALSTTCVLDLGGLSGGTTTTTGQGGAAGGSASSGGGPPDAGPDGAGGCPLLDCSCAAGPTVLAAGTTFADLPRGLAADADGVYWVDFQGGQVMRRRASGGGPEQLAAAVAPRALAVSGQTLVWTESDGVHACTLSSCAGTAHLVTPSLAPGSLRAVAFDGQTVAFTDLGMGPNQGKARACALGACTPIDLAGTLVAPEGLVQDGSLAFWIDQGNGNQNGTVQSSPTSAQAVAQIAASLDLPFGVAVDDTYVYWTQHLPAGHVYRCPRAGGYCDHPEDVAPQAGALGRPADLHLGNGRIYWTNDDDGSIRSCPQPGCGSALPTVHVTGRVGIEKLAVGSSCLFWTENGGGGAVLEVAR
jgi:hypothetical protein